MIKTTQYSLECDCGNESVAEIQVGKTEQVRRNEWIECSACGKPNWCGKVA